jgi:hypothetical protein
MGRHTPGAEAPFTSAEVERPKAEALGYLEAKATAKGKIRGFWLRQNDDVK